MVTVSNVYSPPDLIKRTQTWTLGGRFFDVPPPFLVRNDAVQFIFYFPARVTTKNWTRIYFPILLRLFYGHHPSPSLPRKRCVIFSTFFMIMTVINVTHINIWMLRWVHHITSLLLSSFSYFLHLSPPLTKMSSCMLCLCPYSLPPSWERRMERRNFFSFMRYTTLKEHVTHINLNIPRFLSWEKGKDPKIHMQL